MQGHVRSIDALRDLRIAILEWASRLNEQTFELRSEAQRALQWAKVEQPRHWRRELALAERRLHEAMDYLAATQATYGGRDRPPATEARRRVADLQQRVRFCQQRAAACRRSAAEIERAVERLAGALAAMQQQSDCELPLAANQLSQWIEALDRYAEIAPPTTEPPPPAAETATPTPENRPPSADPDS